MKKNKRIEITTFRRRVMLICGEEITGEDDIVRVKRDDDGHEMIDADSTEGHEILTGAIRLLEERVAKGLRKTDS